MQRARRRPHGQDRLDGLALAAGVADDDAIAAYVAEGGGFDEQPCTLGSRAWQGFAIAVPLVCEIVTLLATALRDHWRRNAVVV